MKLLKFLLLPPLALLLWLVTHSLVIIVDGAVDNVQEVDAIVVLGNKVNDDGTPSKRLQSRLDRAAELYEDGQAEWIILSGGVDPDNGRNEAYEMAAYLNESKGIDLLAMISDDLGVDTYGTANNTKEFMDAYDWDSVLVVSNYYHITRTKLAFHKAGIGEVYSAHARMSPVLRDLYSIPREFVGYYYYLVRGW